MKYDILFDSLGFATASVFINRNNCLIHIGYLDNRNQTIQFNIVMINIPTKEQVWEEYNKQFEKEGVKVGF